MKQPPCESYGSTRSDSPAPPSFDDEALFGWEHRGGLLDLSIEFVTTVGKQFIALSLVLGQIYYSKNLMMSCDTRKAEISMKIGVLCEYTKAYTRCFPLLAVVVTLIVASRMLLCQRMYYKMLIKGAVLNYKDVFPGTDLLFLLLGWSAVNAFGHFILELSMDHPLNVETIGKLMQSEPVLLAKIHEMASLYVIPSLVFMAFLWTAYDMEARLLPLTKYFGEDPQKARKLLSNIRFLDESVAARVVKNHAIDFVDSDGRQLTTDEVFTQFVKRCNTLSKMDSGLAAESCGPTAFSGEASLAGMAFAARDVLLQTDEDLQEFSYVHLISEMWPGRLLLDHRFLDKDSANFRLYWLGCSAMAAITMIAILGLLTERLLDDIADVNSGQEEDISAVVVELAHASIILYLGFVFLKNAVLPYVKAFKDHSGPTSS